ncbi:hypothetical protein [Skermania piniformis]|uniref:Low molecular weight antigen MTB12-like C-terminal domain-containing protein n=1 Tax=Skermania pinensis TaxID=39122 RepID=A0ABX8S7T8_9ACTN|nr:hypothetical protein [Skermania piniformis]QXQ13341.1 hypothetical protein KV203_15955 [Skermania piniformis]
MPKYLRVTLVALFGALLGIGVAQPAGADVSIRNASANDLYLSADAVPTIDQLERQFAAFWNPNIGLDPKVEVSYNGEGARPALARVMESSKTMDFFSIQGRAYEPVEVSGDALAVTVSGLMAGIPATTTRYHLVRDGGLWKYNWKAICQEMQCSGNPDFGY